ncbi:tripartite tricarboxylate transporter substrate binding protein [Bordetella bronchiseptica]|uniref:tripartite tricarboxylate transporter substrate binding protein n=1 Tax=Bordetella bronchiseptica TaxID=518 RepID=UPI000461616E|nr:tripartite tricarboxylate transporter substrate binding protein [Bordetella bronchiseptica]KDD10921.1 tripartite tricarboxylate transporter family receptor [Bordetella bronchiseptica MBORD707]
MKGYARENRRRTLLAAALAGCLLAGGTAHADESGADKRPIRLIVGFSAGGYTDVIARILAEQLGQSLNRSVIVENRAGANGAIGATTVARSAKDGATVLLSPPGLITNTLISPELSYSIQDFAPVARVTSLPNVLVVSANSKYRSLAELLDGARKADGKLTYGSGGVGSSNHLSMALLMRQAQVQMLHVPYKGSSLAETDVMAGHVESMFSGAASAIPHVNGGRFHALAVSGDKRIGALPDVPTVAEAGVPGYSHGTWLGLFVAAGTPAQAVAGLNQAVNKVMADARVQARMTDLGADAFQANTVDEFTAFVQSDLAAQKTLIGNASLSGN